MLQAALFVFACICAGLFLMRMAVRFEGWCERSDRLERSNPLYKRRCGTCSLTLEEHRLARGRDCGRFKEKQVPKAHVVKLGAFMPRRSKCHHEPMLWYIDGRLQPVCRVCFELNPKLGGEMP